jgi:hypothetical protein
MPPTSPELAFERERAVLLAKGHAGKFAIVSGLGIVALLPTREEAIKTRAEANRVEAWGIFRVELAPERK